MRWLGGITDSMGSQRVGHDWATELNWITQMNRWEETVTRDLLTTGQLAFLLGSESRKKEGDRTHIVVYNITTEVTYRYSCQSLLIHRLLLLIVVAAAAEVITFYFSSLRRHPSSHTHTKGFWIFPVFQLAENTSASHRDTSQNFSLLP